MPPVTPRPKRSVAPLPSRHGEGRRRGAPGLKASATSAPVNGALQRIPRQETHDESREDASPTLRLGLDIGCPSSGGAPQEIDPQEIDMELSDAALVEPEWMESIQPVSDSGLSVLELNLPAPTAITAVGSAVGLAVERGSSEAPGDGGAAASGSRGTFFGHVDGRDQAHHLDE